MLSEATNPVGSAHPPPTANSPKSDAKCWLPELNAPRISLDLSSLSPSGFSANAAANSSATIDSAPASHAMRQSDSSTNKVCSVELTSRSDQDPANHSSPAGSICAGLSDYGGMISQNTSQPSTDDHATTQSSAAAAAATTPVRSASTALSSPQQTQRQPAAFHALSGNDCDTTSHLGLVFDFHTNPEVDAISTSPLFAIPKPVATAAASCAAADDPQPLSTPPSHSPRAVDAAVVKQPLASTSDAEPIFRKTRSRRASIAGMLMRRASKYLEITPNAAIATATASAEPLPESDSDTNACGVGAQPESLPGESPKPAAQLVPSKSTDASNCDANTSNTHKDKVSDDLPPPTTTRVSTENEEPVHKSGGASTSSAAVAEDDDSSAQSVGMDVSSGSTDAVKENITANTAGSNAVAAVDQVSEHNRIQSGEESLADQSHTCNKLENPVAVSRPSTGSHSPEKRTSRIFGGISRKVNHVRQTTSMVLRRSVGSRLSVIPDKSLENLDHAAQGRIDASTTNRGGAASDREDPPEYSVDDRVGASSGRGIGSTHQGTNTDAANVDNGTVSSDVGSADTTSGHALAKSPVLDSNTTGAETTAGVVEEDNTVDITAVAAAEPKPNTSGEEKSNKDSLDARATFSRRFGMVRRGTNEAVRSGVSRMRSMFAAKNPVAA
ncbi:hypothetical protein COEREDRAFT_11963 [Coemansia reversa NRRL 1564]|uniref:Uncharacterized protein n=1 Tax=Coemansia reversa (strain ATCC 12441 / NRRL 1564) TaxID=763665 RepID=A0A2G5B1N0_COERN|nr:hypothetical protein COEREDRAFT_11963 [Coemansia reversa NRRL 1564]|eukprot:PIA12928.1 hypothetical protein COEREDRAFT_11963 [Coemansia reversa NRRL 1564]